MVFLPWCYTCILAVSISNGVMVAQGSWLTSLEELMSVLIIADKACGSVRAMARVNVTSALVSTTFWKSPRIWT